MLMEEQRPQPSGCIPRALVILALLFLCAALWCGVLYFVGVLP